MAGAAVTPQDMVDALHYAFGDHHSRALYAKGVMLEGQFVPAPSARTLSSAVLFLHEDVPVLARFSDFTGMPSIPDTSVEANPRGLSLQFSMRQQRQYLDVLAPSYDGFPTATAAEFRELLVAIGMSGGGAAAPTALDRFLATHPIAKTFFSGRKPPPVSYATLGYFGVNTFRFTNSRGAHCHVRYRFVPRAGEQYLDVASVKTRGPDYLLEEMRERCAREPILFDWVAQVADPGDAIDDPSVSWPPTRQQHLLGSISLTRPIDDMPATDRKTLFLPANLPDGIAPADSMLDMRNAVYPLSYRHRQ
jgi:catalase